MCRSLPASIRSARLRRFALIACAALIPVAATAVDLLDAEVRIAGGRVVEDAGQTIRLEAPRVASIERRGYALPEPGGVFQMGFGIGAIALLKLASTKRTARRRRC
jgi:hypothetical protein